MNYTSAMQTKTNGHSLTKGWQWVKLSEVTRVVAGTTPKSGVGEYWNNGNIVWITPTDLGGNDDKDVFTSLRLITKEGFDSCGLELVPPGSVVLSSRAPIGHLGIANVPLCTNQGCKSFVPSERIDSAFLYFALKQAVPVLQELGSGATFKEVSKTQLENFEIPLPPLDEQRRIASRLNDQLAEVESARKASEEQLRVGQELPFAYFRHMFQGVTPLTASTYRDEAPRGWGWKKLTTIARLESGHTPSRYHAEWWGGSIPWIALPDIRALDGKVAYETLEYTNEQGIANSSARILPAGTVCISRTASVGFVTIMGREMATSQDFFDWVCGPEIDNYFLMYLLLVSRDYFRSISSGAVHKTVYMPTAKALEVCIPSIDEQRRIAEFLKEKLSSSEQLIGALESQLDEIHRLPASLLREAFAGQG